MSDKSENCASKEATDLKNAIKAYRRDEVTALLKQGALEKLEEEEQLSVCQKLIGMRSMEIVEILSKKSSVFVPEILKMDFSSWNNREFVQKVLAKYRKKFQLGDEETCNQLFEIACEAGSADTVRALIKQKKAVSSYPLLGGVSSDAVFEAVSMIKPSDLSSDQTVELLFLAACSVKGIDRLEKLKSLGYDLKAKNSENATVETLLSEKIHQGKYTKNRSGEQIRNRERQVLQYLRCPESEEDGKSKKKIPWKPILACAAIVIVVSAIIAGGALTSASDSADSDETSSQVDSDSDSDYDSSYYYDSDSDADEYSTDTSLTVADGDTVNIDYTGYIDDVAFDGGSTDGAGTSLTIGSGMYIDDFEEQLIGHNVGETVEVNVTFPEDYGVDDLNGQDATFVVTINGIYE